jgi:hypothetical protein
MHDYTLAHLGDAALLRDLAALVAQDRLTTAKLLAHIAEADARRLYAPAGYPSMFAYCVEELGLSEDAAYKRIQAARAARRFPVLLSAMAEGRLHLAGVCLLVPHITEGTVEELIDAATHRRKSEIEAWLVRRFGSPEPRAMIRAVTPAAPEVAPGQVGSDVFARSHELFLGQAGTDGAGRDGELAPGRVGDGVRGDELAPGQAEAPTPAPSPERYLIQVTVEKSTHDKLRHAQALLSHAVPGGNVAKVFDRALDALITQLEKKKFGAAVRPRLARHPRTVRRGSTPRGRHIPSPIRRAVWERDHGQCTFVSANGTRCEVRHLLEFDHIEPVAKGGRATIEGMRLRCRAHNQFEAERAFGPGFMICKREEARTRAAKRRATRLAAAEGRAAEARGADARAAALERLRDVMAGLRSLGCRADEARRAAESTEQLQGAPVEERIRAALQFLGSRSTRGRTPWNGSSGSATALDVVAPGTG